MNKVPLREGGTEGIEPRIRRIVPVNGRVGAGNGNSASGNG